MKKRNFVKYGIMALGILVGFVISVNLYVRVSTSSKMVEDNNYSKIPHVDCVLILGAGVWGNNPSPILQDRLIEGINLYKSGITNKIIMTGDHGRKEYDEVNVMKKFATDRGIPSEDVFMDHAGFSTYESIYRAKEIFGAKKVVIVTQKYHLSRALYIANQLDIDAYGVVADTRNYAGQQYREIREVLARNKDFIMCVFKPKPTYLGDVIPVSGDGNITNDIWKGDNL